MCQLRSPLTTKRANHCHSQKLKTQKAAVKVIHTPPNHPVPPQNTSLRTQKAAVEANQVLLKVAVYHPSQAKKRMTARGNRPVVIGKMRKKDGNTQ